MSDDSRKLKDLDSIQLDDVSELEPDKVETDKSPEFVDQKLGCVLNLDSSEDKPEPCDDVVSNVIGEHLEQTEEFEVVTSEIDEEMCQIASVV